MAHPHGQQEVAFNKGDDMGAEYYTPQAVDTAHVQPKGSLNTDGSSGNGQHRHGLPEMAELGHGNGNDTTNNVVLEQDAQTKGRWFRYFRTKQFWITLVLGQGMCHSSHMSTTTWESIQSHFELTNMNSPGHLYHLHQHLLSTPQRRRHQHSRFPKFLQLRPPQSGLHFLHHLSIRVQRLGLHGLALRLAFPDPRVFRRRR